MTLPLLLAAIAVPTPVTLTSTVTLVPEEGRFEMRGVLVVANEAEGPLGGAAFELGEGLSLSLSATVGAIRAEGGRMEWDPPIPAGGRRSFSFVTGGKVDRPSWDYVRADAALLKASVYPYYPMIDEFTDMRTCVVAPAGWTAHATGDPVDGCFRAKSAQWVMVAARKEAVVKTSGPYRVVVSPSNAKAAEPLLAQIERVASGFEKRFGPRPTKTLTVVEVDFDGGFSNNALIVIHPKAVATFAGNADELPFVVHEIAHQWFGSIANGEAAIREGLATWSAYDDARRRGAGDAYRAKLIAQEKRARPGLTIREANADDHGWRSYDAVAYARGALVWDRLREEIGDERFERFVRAHLEGSRGKTADFATFFAPLATIAPDFDLERFVAEKIDGDWDPATNTVRPPVWTLTGKIAAALAGLAGLLALSIGLWRGRSKGRVFVELVPAGLLAFLLVRTHWVHGWPIAAGLAVVLIFGAMRSHRVAVIGWVGWFVLLAAVQVAR